MADAELVKRLLRGSGVWNAWRRTQRNANVQFDLSSADLSGINLSGANLNDANLNDANLASADLSNSLLVGSHLTKANLHGARLSSADLTKANLSGASLSGAHLINVDLSDADLNGANLSDADLSGADLRRVDLSDADLNGARMSGAHLSGVRLAKTILANLDLRQTKGLLDIQHYGPSHVELYTVQLPQDGSTLHFLRGAGVPDEWIIDYRAHMMLPIQYHSVFISYSSRDDLLARRLHADLQDRGVRCWFAPEDMKIGDKIRTRIDEAIHLQDKLLLLLSEYAIENTWVEDEVEAAIEKEDRQKREVLFPVRLDESVMQTTHAWAAKLRRTRHIGDFTKWADPHAYQRAFERLLRDLKKADKRQDQEMKL